MSFRICSAVFSSSRRRHTRYWRDWSSDVCSSDLAILHHIAHFGGGGTAGYLGSVSEKGQALSYDDLLATTLLHGSAETVIARLRALQAQRSEERRVGNG